MAGDIALVLLYEPHASKGRPIPLCRVDDPRIIADAACAAIEEARDRADAISSVDSILGEIETADVDRLKSVLRLLVRGAVCSQFDRASRRRVQA